MKSDIFLPHQVQSSDTKSLLYGCFAFIGRGLAMLAILYGCSHEERDSLTALQTD